MLISLFKFFAGILLYLPIFFPAMVQLEPTMYLSDLSSSSEGILGRLEESETSSRPKRGRSTRCHNIRIKFNKQMEYFVRGGWSCSYDDDTVGYIEIPLRYNHLVKQCVPMDLPQFNTDFCVNERIYRIALSSLHGLGCFAWMD